MSAPAFVVAGSGRSGSRYIASVLTAAGLLCGHEAYWNEGRPTPGLLGDSSWLAADELGWFAENGGGVVFHQVRHPLDVVTSLVAVPTHGGYREVQDRLLPGLPAVDGLERAVGVCVGLNGLAETHAVLRWQVERVTAELVVEIGRLIGVPVAFAPAALAVASVPTTLNRHRDGPRISWDDLPAGACTDELLEQAYRYGYYEPLPDPPDEDVEGGIDG